MSWDTHSVRTSVSLAPAGVPVESPPQAGPRLPDYLDPDAHLQERRILFDPARAGLFLGRTAGVGAPSHRRCEADDRLLLSRTSDGEFLALANLCPHAVRPLSADDQPVDRARITCPYHQWSFRLDGSFIGAPLTSPCPSERDRARAHHVPGHGMARPGLHRRPWELVVRCGSGGRGAVLRRPGHRRLARLL